jgi:hypothetical protein
MASCANSDLLSVIDCYMAATGLPHAAFGRASANDPWLVTAIRNGAEVPDVTANRVLDYIIGDLEGRMQPEDSLCHAMGGRLLEAVV